MVIAKCKNKKMATPDDLLFTLQSCNIPVKKNEYLTTPLFHKKYVQQQMYKSSMVNVEIHGNKTRQDYRCQNLNLAQRGVAGSTPQFYLNIHQKFVTRWQYIKRAQE